MRLTKEHQDEIAGQRGEMRQTRRATVPALEAILYEPLPVLDHGFVRVVDYMGDEAAQRVLDLLRRDAERAYAGYSDLLNEDASGAPIDPERPGLARELARINLSLGFYTQWYWKTDLHNLMHFLSLRADPHAQYEIRAYAEAMLDTLARWVPMTHAAFLEYRMNAALISATGLALIRAP